MDPVVVLCIIALLALPVAGYKWQRWWRSTMPPWDAELRDEGEYDLSLRDEMRLARESRVDYAPTGFTLLAWIGVLWVLIDRLD